MPIKQCIYLRNQVPIKIWTDDCEPEATVQLQNCAGMKFIHKWIAAMPDVHAGYGATIGSVIPTKGAIIPSAVGVDIGCGMNAVRLSLTADQLPDNLHTVRTEIEKNVPVGFSGHGSKVDENLFPTRLLQSNIFDNNLGIHDKPFSKAIDQLGTLGGGNHFIEVCLDENNQVWVMLHSGSRGIGNCIGRYFIELAKKEMEKYFITLPDKDLAFFTENTELFNNYIEAVNWAQDYALENRALMMKLTLAALRKHLPEFELTSEAINCHHNYVAHENHYGSNVYVTRKGAIRARKNDLGIIPGSMGAKSFIVKGVGNKESFCSCSHGAGRKMSRTKARNLFTVQDLSEQTLGIECPKDEARLDEIPSAYKSIDTVMENQSDLVQIVHTLRQVINIKG